MRVRRLREIMMIMNDQGDENFPVLEKCVEVEASYSERNLGEKSF